MKDCDCVRWERLAARRLSSDEATSSRAAEVYGYSYGLY